MKLTRRIFTLCLVMVLFVSSMSITAFAKGDIKYGIGFTTGTQLRLRANASTSSAVLDVAEKKGEVVVVVSKAGDWYKVIYNLQEGYMHKNYVSVLTAENAELGYGKINASGVNLRTGPGTNYKSVAVGGRNAKVYIIGLNKGWYKVIYGNKISYIRSDYVDLTEIPYENMDSSNSPKFFRGGKSTGVAPSAAALNGTTGSTNSGANNSGSAGTSTGSASGQAIANTAKKYLGVPYVYGGASPSGFDCSGFVYYVLKTLGYSPSRMLVDLYTMGTSVSKSNLQPGDVVFFQNTYKNGISHAGIYVGNGQFIHSPNSRSNVSYADLTTGYWSNHYYGARRVAN